MIWPKVALGDVTTIVSGATPRTSERRYWDGDILWTTPKDLSDLETPYLERPSRTITKEGLASCSASLLPVNSVLLSSRAPIGLIAINLAPVATNQGFKSLVPDANRLDSKFLYHWLRSKTSFLQNLGNGATFKEISKAVVERIEIPLPSLDEQRRLAAILDKADGLRRKRKRALDLLNSLNQSAFMEMFPNIAGHGDITLGEFSDIQVGFAFKSSEYTERSDGVRLCRGANILPNSIDWSDLARWPNERAWEFREYTLCSADIVIAMDRPWISSGFKVARIEDKDLPALLVQRVARLRAREEVDAEFLFGLVKSPFFSRHFKPTETTVPHISPLDVRSFSFRQASRNRKKAFSEFSMRSRAAFNAAAAAMEYCENLFSSLQQRVFSTDSKRLPNV